MPLSSVYQKEEETGLDTNVIINTSAVLKEVTEAIEKSSLADVLRDKLKDSYQTIKQAGIDIPEPVWQSNPFSEIRRVTDPANFSLLQIDDLKANQAVAYQMLVRALEFSEEEETTAGDLYKKALISQEISSAA